MSHEDSVADYAPFAGSVSASHNCPPHNPFLTETSSLDDDVNLLSQLSARISDRIRSAQADLTGRRSELHSEIDAERDRLHREIAEERAKLAQEREEISRVVSRIHAMSGDEHVALNVGGEVFATSVKTIAMAPSSLLAVLVSGDFPVDRDANGAILIDREPRFFSHILEFLRTLRYDLSSEGSTGDAAADSGGDEASDGGDMSRSVGGRNPAILATYHNLSQDDQVRFLEDVRFFNLEPLERILKPNVLVVSAEASSRYKRISEALQDARDGDTVLVKKGSYIDSFVLMRAVSVVGEGPGRTDVIIRSPVATAVECRTHNATISNMTIEGVPPGFDSSSGAQMFGDCYGVFVSDGSIKIENCEIRNVGLSCIKIVGNPKAPDDCVSVIDSCSIHNANQCGVLVTNHAKAVIRHATIYDNRFSGVEIRNHAKPKLYKNSLHNNTQNGIYVHTGGEGLIQGCKVFSNRFNGINVEGAVTISKNVIYDNLKRGIFHGPTAQLMDDNRVYSNTMGDIAPKR